MVSFGVNPDNRARLKRKGEMIMKIKAAVLREPKKPYTIEELELEPPRQG